MNLWQCSIHGEVIIIIIIIIIYTQLLIGDNDLNNHNDYCSYNVIAKLQTYKNKE